MAQLEKQHDVASVSGQRHGEEGCALNIAAVIEPIVKHCTYLRKQAIDGSLIAIPARRPSKHCSARRSTSKALSKKPGHSGVMVIWLSLARVEWFTCPSEAGLQTNRPTMAPHMASALLHSDYAHGVQ